MTNDTNRLSDSAKRKNVSFISFICSSFVINHLVQKCTTKG